MSITIPLQRFIIGFAVLTTFGVLVHDTKLDQATTIALAIPIGMSFAAADAVKLKSDAHTHVERASFDKSARIVNSVPPRNDRRRFVLPKHEDSFGEPEQHTMVMAPALALA